MKRRGFTLIELLAVIVILSVIAIITVPMVMNVIEESKRGSFKVTCNQIYRAYEQYEISNELIGTTGTCTVFDFGSTRTETEIIDGIRYEPISKLNLKGEMPKLGTYKICNDTRNLVIDNGIYTCVKDGTREEILEGSIADNDLTAPILNDITLSSTSNSIRVIVDATETDGLITKYVYKLNGEEKVSSNNTYTFERLSGTEEFTVEVYVENKSGLKSESISKSIRLKGIEPTTYEESQTPEETEYATSKKIEIKYDTQEGIEKYFKSNVEIEVAAGIVVGECGNETDPGTCTTSNATTLEAETWYKTDNVNPSVIYRANGKLYALTSDGKNISGTSIYTISKIDTSEPNVSISDISEIKTDRVTITAVCSDSESEITKYEYSDGTTWYDGGTNSSYTITGLTKEQEYEFKVRCTNGSGITNEAKASESTLGMTNPSIEYENTPTTAVNGYLTSQTLKVTYTSTNIASPEYFIKTTRKGTSNLNVTSTCGSGDEPGTCTSITSTTTLEEDKWYKVSGNVNVTYNEHATSTGKLYAITYDGTNYSGSSSGTISKIDTSAPNVSISDISEIKTDRVTITAVCSDSETGITKYEYSDGTTWYNGGTNSSYTITGLAKEQEYEFKVRCTNGLNKTNESSSSESTLGMTNPSMKQTAQVPTSGYTWATSRTIGITYTSTNINSPEYYFKSSVSATVSSGVVTATCGSGDEPGTCTTSNVTTLEAGKWYKTTNTNPSITYTSNGKLYALTSDGKNISGTSTYTISKIDTSEPNVSISDISEIKTDRVTIKAVCSDSESEITKYEYSDGTTWYNGGTNSSYTITGLTKEQEYEFKVRCTNGSGITNEAKASESTLGITNPTMKQTAQVPTSGYTWATSRTIGIIYTSTNINSPEYYFKSSVSATVSSGVVTATCGSGDEPGTCTSSSVTTLVAGTWYKTTNKNPSIVYTSNGKLYALTSDGKNVSGTSTYTISKISTGTPTTPTITGGSEDWTTTSRTISVSTASKETSGILKYQYYISTSSSSQTGGSWIDCSTSTTSQTITTNGTNYIFFRAVANNGNVSGVSNYQVTKISSNSYTKYEIDSLVNELTTNVQTNTTSINSTQSDLDSIDLSIYATQEELTNTNNRVNQLSETIKSNSDRLTALEN